MFHLHHKQLCPWEVCSLNDPWPSEASHSLMHFINWCTWKSSQYYIIVIMMASFMHVSCNVVFHQSKCISAIKRIPSTNAMYTSSSSFIYLCIPCCCDAKALRAGVKTLHSTIITNGCLDLRYCVFSHVGQVSAEWSGCVGSVAVC